MKLVLGQFFGTAPKFNEEQIADGYASESQNARPGREILEPWKAPSALANGTLNNALVKSLFKYVTKWFSWTTRGVTAVNAPLTNDPYDYVIIADPNTYPQITENTIAETGVGPYPATTRRVGVPAPDAPGALTVGPNPAWTDPGDLIEDDFDLYETSYILVYVDAWGRVGPASEPSERKSIREYQFENTNQVTIPLPTAVPADLHNSDVIRGTNAKIRIYRANYSSGGSGVYQYVDEVDVGTTEYLDTKAGGDLLEAISTEDWVGPPDDDATLFPNGPLRNIIVAANRFMVGHNDRIVAMSEPNTTHAWPPRYYQVVEDNKVALSPAGANFVLLTDGYPYVFSGVHPETVSATKLSDPVPCASSEAVTEVDDAVFFASEMGMFVIRGYAISNVSKNYLTESEWRALGPSTMKFANYDGRVFIACPDVGYTFVYDPKKAEDGFRRVNINPQAVAQIESTADLAYVEDGATEISQFDSHATDYMPLTWRSKVYQVNHPVCFSVAKVRANNFPVDVTFKCRKLDGVEETFTKTVQSDQFFFLPFSNYSRHWWVEVNSAGGTERPEIRSIQLGQSPEEFD